MGAAKGIILAAFVLLYGLSQQGPLVLMPLVIADAVGKKRFGTIYGAMRLPVTAAAAMGAGRIFDVTGSYALAFELFVVLALIGSVTSLACTPLGSGQTALAPAESS